MPSTRGERQVTGCRAVLQPAYFTLSSVIASPMNESVAIQLEGAPQRIQHRLHLRAAPVSPLP